MLFAGAGIAAVVGKNKVAEVGPPTPERAVERRQGGHRHREGRPLMTNQTPEEIQAEIEAQREQLAGRVDALAAKLDVKTQAQAKVAEVKDRATTDDGKPRPELLVGRCRRRAWSPSFSCGGGDDDGRQGASGETATEPDAGPRRRARSPTAPRDLDKRSWKYVARKTCASSATTSAPTRPRR